MEPNLSEKEGYEYGNTMFEQLPDIYVDSNKYQSAPSADVSNGNDIEMKEENDEDKEI